MTPAGVVGAVVIAKYAARVIDHLPFHIRMALQEFFQVVMLGEIFFAVDQLWVAPQVAGNFGVILKKVVKLANFVSYLVMIAPSQWCRGEER